MMSRLWLLIIPLLTIIWVGCGLSISQYRDIVEGARSCQSGDICVAAGGTQCTCPVPVNQKNQPQLSQIAKDVNCGNIAVDCAAWTNLRCENKRCTGDMVTD
jgi:hypothetical protein